MHVGYCLVKPHSSHHFPLVLIETSQTSSVICLLSTCGSLKQQDCMCDTCWACNKRGPIPTELWICYLNLEPCVACNFPWCCERSCSLTPVLPESFYHKDILWALETASCLSSSITCATCVLVWRRTDPSTDRLYWLFKKQPIRNRTKLLS